MEATIEVSPADQAARLIKLLKEYTRKLLELWSSRKSSALLLEEQTHAGANNSLLQNWMASEDQADRQLVHTLQPAVDDLIRQTSQMIEHGRLDSALKVEMRLRLAELEGARQKLIFMP